MKDRARHEADEADLVELCRLCVAPLYGATLELGRLPPCNRFGLTGEVPPVHPLAMLACEACGFAIVTGMGLVN